MKFYVIEYDDTEWVYSTEDRCGYRQVTGRCYYTSSNAQSVDPTDVQYAKLFPNKRSVKSALQWVGGNPKVFEVETSVIVLGEVEV